MNFGEQVRSGEHASLVAMLNAGTYDWWRDFNSNNDVESGDYAPFVAHLNPTGHDCSVGLP
jgi:hypothetical protein